jgi:macrolide-specific efflux system membrane fusion protein
MKKILSVSLIIIVTGAGAWFWTTKKANGRQKAQSVRIITVERGNLEDTVEATGDVTPMNRVEIKPPISGRIEELLVDEGDAVKRGQIIAWMSSSDRAAILDAARAKGPDELKKWEDTYKPTPIVAPLSGVLILKNVVVGQMVDAGTVLFAMSDRLIVLANVDEADIGRVKNGASARIVLDAYPDQAITGKVIQILHEGKNISNVITYGVKIIPDSTPAFFRSQMTANVTLILNHKDNVLLLPSDALSQGSDGSYVLVPGPDKKPITKQIKTGLQSGNRVEIIEGLVEGDSVVIARGHYVPQQGPQTSPLTFNPPNRQQNTSRGNSRERQQQR